MQFTSGNSTDFYFVLILVISLPFLYAIIRVRFSGVLSQMKSYLVAIIAGDIMAILFFIFGLSIYPEESDKAYLLVAALAAGIGTIMITSDFVFRIRHITKPTGRKKK